ncbi:MAG TPA: MFS transporter [Terriglobia bacterium]|nr:MFS transporter [Terriglobia bacterium]
MIVLGVSLATGIELGTQVAVNIILVDMKGNIAASQDQISWVIIVYSAAFFSVLPLTDWFARRLSHRKYLVASLLLYATGAFGCFSSHSLSELLVARAIMGLGGGAFLVRGLITLFKFYDPQHRRIALMTFALFVTSSRALMPVLFGAVTDMGRWNLAFLVLVPLALIAAAFLYISLPRGIESEVRAPSVDPLGTACLVTGLIALQVVMSRGEQDMWFQSRLICLMAVLCILSLAAFIWSDMRPDNPNPLLNLRVLLADSALTSGIGVAIILGALLAAGLYLLPLFLRGIQGYSATQTAWFFCVDGISTLLGILMAIRLMPKLTPRGVVLLGLCMNVAANSLLVFMLTPDTPALDLCAILVLHGVSLGILLPSVTNMLLGHAHFRYIAFGMTIYYTFRQLGGSIGVAVTVALLDIRETFHSSRLLDTANRLNPTVSDVVRHLGFRLHAQGLPSNLAHEGAFRLFQLMVAKQTALLAFIDVFWGLALLGLVAIVIVLVLARRGMTKAVPVSGIPQHY